MGKDAEVKLCLCSQPYPIMIKIHFKSYNANMFWTLMYLLLGKGIIKISYMSLHICHVCMTCIHIYVYIYVSYMSLYTNAYMFDFRCSRQRKI